MNGLFFKKKKEKEEEQNTMGKVFIADIGEKKC